MMKTNFKTLTLLLLLFLSLLLFGCTDRDIVLPYTTSQLIGQSTDLNYTLFKNGDYNGLFLIIDGNKLSTYDLNFAAEEIPWDSLINFPSGCSDNQAVKIVGSSLVCVDLTTDTNFQTAGYDFNDYALLDGSNQPFTGDINISKADPEISLTDTGNSEYARWVRSDTLNQMTLYNRVSVLGAATDQIPTMTGFTTPSGEASASSTWNSSYSAWKAFDDLYSSYSHKWLSGSGEPLPQWLKYKFDTAKKITKYTIRNGDNTTYTLNNWTLQGSNNDSDWTDLDTQTGQASGWGVWVKKTYALGAATDEYLYYRLYITSTGATGAGSNAIVGEMELIDEDPTTQEATIVNSQDSDTSGEWGINTFGDFAGRTVIDGSSTRFNNGGVEQFSIDSSGDLVFPDNYSTYWGTAKDASIKYDGSNLLINPQEVGSGYVNIGTTTSNKVLQLDGGANGLTLMDLVRTGSNAGNYGFSMPSGRFAIRDNTNSVGLFSLYYDSAGATPRNTFIAAQDNGANSVAGVSSRIRAGNAGTTGTDIVGGDLYLSGGLGRGDGTPSSIYFQTPDKVGSGTDIQTFSTKMIIDETGIGIGTDSPNYPVEVVADGMSFSTAFEDSQMLVKSDVDATSSSRKYTGLLLESQGWYSGSSQPIQAILQLDPQTNANPAFYIRFKMGSDTPVLAFGIDRYGYFQTPIRRTNYMPGAVANEGISLVAGGVATALAPEQYAPYIAMRADVWDTSTSSSKDATYRNQVETTSGASPTSELVWYGQIGTTNPTNKVMSIDESGNLRLVKDNGAILLGAGQDASVYYDGSNLLINPQEVGSGATIFTGRIGVNQSNPTETLEVNGGLEISGASLGSSNGLVLSNESTYSRIQSYAGKPIYLNPLGNNVVLHNDSSKLVFGAGNDASIYYNGSNLLINPQEVGSGATIFTGNANFGTKTVIKTDGNILMTSPDSTVWNCGVSNSGVFECS